MPYMKDRLYLFSLTRGGVASLVASVSDEKADRLGENFFSKFEIDGSQVNKMMAIIEDDTKGRIFALKGRSRIYLVFGNFSYETGIFIAIEPRVPAGAVKSLLDSGSFGNINICFEDEDFSLNEADAVEHIEEYQRVCETVSYLDAISRFETEKDGITAEDVERNITRLADFIGLSINYSIIRKSVTERSNIIFAGGFCAVAFLLMAAVAHKYSSNKALGVEAECHGGVMAFRLSFAVGRGREWMSVLESLRNMAARCHDIYFSYREPSNDKSERLILEFLPFYEDAGLLGVKKGEALLDDPSLAHFKDFFILNGISDDKINNNEQ